jgi:hypothetical protein
MSDVADVRKEMRAFAEGARCPDDLRGKIHAWADRLERKQAVQKVAGVKRTDEQIDRDNLRVLETKIAYPHLKLQELSDRAQMNNIGRVSECLNKAQREWGSYETARDVLRNKIHLTYDRAHR